MPPMTEEVVIVSDPGSNLILASVVDEPGTLDGLDADVDGVG